MCFAATLTHNVDFLVLSGQQTVDLMVVRGKQDLMIRGPRLNQTKEDKMLVRHGPDRRLDPIITPSMPLMEVALTLMSVFYCLQTQSELFNFEYLLILSLNAIYL